MMSVVKYPCHPLYVACASCSSSLHHLLICTLLCPIQCLCSDFFRKCFHPVPSAGTTTAIPNGLSRHHLVGTPPVHLTSQRLYHRRGITLFTNPVERQSLAAPTSVQKKKRLRFFRQDLVHREVLDKYSAQLSSSFVLNWNIQRVITQSFASHVFRGFVCIRVRPGVKPTGRTSTNA